MAQIHTLEIQNYRSFYNRQELHFGEDENRAVTALFGINSGGKSNTARALSLMQSFIRGSAAANWIVPYDPFLLAEESETEPTYFKIAFSDGEKRYTYEFGYTMEKVVFEELKEKSANTQKMKSIFRNENGVLNAAAAKNGFGETLRKKTRKETLLITKAQENNNKYANSVFRMIDSIRVILGDDPNIAGFAIEILGQHPELREKTLALLKKCDFHIRGLETTEVIMPTEIIESLPVPEEIKKQLSGAKGTALMTSHSVRDGERSVIGERQFDFLSQESMGTKKFFETAVPIIFALEFELTLYIDEFGAFLNPILAASIVDHFKESAGKSKAHLILNTHSTSIMTGAKLTRDEIIFIEKTFGEESRILPLSEMSVRGDEAFEKRYLTGLYGATPVIRERA